MAMLDKRNIDSPNETRPSSRTGGSMSSQWGFQIGRGVSSRAEVALRRRSPA